MYAKKMMVIDDFMILSGLLEDDIDLICDFIAEKIPKSIKKYKRSRVKSFIENADYMKIEEEIEYLLDLNIVEYKTFCIFRKLKRQVESAKQNFVQTTLDDYMWTR